MSSPPEKNATHPAKSRPGDDKLAAFMAYRKPKGLCYKCGDKWGPNHKCPTSVSLHAVEEIWKFCTDEGSGSVATTQTPESDSDDDLMAVSAQAVTGIEGP